MTSTTSPVFVSCAITSITPTRSLPLVVCCLAFNQMLDVRCWEFDAHARREFKQIASRCEKIRVKRSAHLFSANRELENCFLVGRTQLALSLSNGSRRK